MTVFANRRFRRLFVGDALSSLGDNALYLSLGIWIKELTGSDGAAGSVFLAMGIPLLLAPFVGHLIDRVPKRRVLLIVINVVTAGVVSMLFAVRSVADIWIIYAVASAYGLSSIALGACRNAFLKDLIPAADLPAANAAFGTLAGCLRIASPLLGAGLYVTTGAATLIVVDILTFPCAIAALVGIRVTESAVEAKKLACFRTEVLAGFSYVRRVDALRRVTVIGAIAFGAIGFLEPVVFAVIDHGLGRPASFFGIVASAQGVGAVIGGLTASRLARRFGEARALGVGLTSLAVGGLGLCVPVTSVVLMAAGCVGAAFIWLSVGLVTALHRHTPTRLMGRVSATANMLANGPQTGSIALGSALVIVADYRLLLVAVAAAVFCCGFSLLVRPAAEVIVPADGAAWIPIDPSVAKD